MQDVAYPSAGSKSYSRVEEDNWSGTFWITERCCSRRSQSHQQPRRKDQPASLQAAFDHPFSKSSDLNLTGAPMSFLHVPPRRSRLYALCKLILGLPWARSYLEITFLSLQDVRYPSSHSHFLLTYLSLIGILPHNSRRLNARYGS